ncbi:MAG: hypothetical protein ASARMPREDX12_003599 [Alectoria sarmentosa]|nr:MAG: hypothetical protein ASARMPREDX12_003599 [Alectoria sarmentosa]
MSPHRHRDDEVKEQVIWEFEVCNHLGVEEASVNDFHEPLAFCDTTQNSPARFLKSTLPPATAYKSNVMDACGIESNDLCAALHAITDSSSGSVSRAALAVFVQGTTELGSANDASALPPHIEAREKQQMGQATGGLEVGTVASRLDALDVQGNNCPATQMMRGGGLSPRSMKMQAGKRSRFRPWGYI